MKLQHEFFLQAVADSQYLTDGICEDSMALFLRVLKQDEGLLTEGPLQNIQKEIKDKTPTTLTQFAKIINSVLTALEFQSSFAFSACYLIEDRIYLVTAGLGGIFITQNNKVARLIMGEQNASGRPKPDELLILGAYDTTFKDAQTSSLNLIGEEFDEKMTNLYSLHDIGGFVVSHLMQDVPTTAVAQVRPDEDNKNVPNEEEILSTTTGSTKKRKITLIASVVIILILFWSVVFGYQRRQRQEILSVLKQTEPQIESKIQDAEEELEFDPHAAKSLASEAELLFEPIWQKAQKNNLTEEKDVKQIHERIEATISKISNVGNKKPEEFYDLTLLSKNVNITRLMPTDDDSIGFLDTEHKKIYQVAIEKKSVKTFSPKKLTDKSLAVIDKNRLFFTTSDGIFMDDYTNNKKIANHEEWGNVVDFITFNGNLYLLDIQKDEIYKYLVVDASTFSNKNSYFKTGQSVDLKNATSFAVDGAFYIGFSDGKVLKYISGIKQDFTLKSPRELKVSKVLTNINTDNLYVFDQKQGVVFVFSKEGEYKKEIVSRYLKDATNMALIKGDKIIFQASSKIYILK